MTTDPMGAVSEMIRIYRLLHPSLRSGRGVAWEMDLDTFEALLTWRLPVSRTEILQRLANGELRCLGIPVSVVERLGVRLIIKAVPG